MISIVISTFKRELKILLRAVNSVVCSSYSEWELIIVDDSPETYKERALIKDYFKNVSDSRIVYIQHEKTKGACAARNTGLNIAKGEYIGFLDDDDEWLPNKLSVMLDEFKKSSSDTALVYCGYYLYDDLEKTRKKRRDIVFKKGKIYRHLIKYNFIGSCSFPLLKTQCLKDIGGFDEEFPSCQDYDVWLRIAKKYDVSYVKQRLVIYHVHSQESIGKNNEKKIRGQELLFKKHYDYLLKHKSAMWHRLKQMSVLYSNNNEQLKAKKCVNRMFVIMPIRLLSNLMTLFRILKKR